MNHASYCSPCAPCLFEEVRLSVDGPDPDAFLSSGGDEDGLQFAAFNSLQHGLRRHAKFRHGCKHRYIPVQRLICEAGPQFVAEANAPGSARCDLLALNQAVLKVTKQRRCCDAKRGRGLSKRYDLAHGSATGFARTHGNLLPSPQPLDSVYVKPMPSCCFASLHVEDGSNNSVGVLFGQTPHQSHGLLIRLGRRGTRRGPTCASFRSRSTVSVMSSMRARSNSLRSRGVVVRACHTVVKSGPKFRRRSRSSGVRTRGRSRSRRASSIRAASSAFRLFSHSRSRERATKRLSGSTAW